MNYREIGKEQFQWRAEHAGLKRVNNGKKKLDLGNAFVFESSEANRSSTLASLTAAAACQNALLT